MTDFADIASYQHGADLTTYARSADRILIKATQGAAYVTPDFRVWWPLAATLRLARGAYHFVDPEVATPTAEAAHLLATVGALGWRDWVVLDVERPSPPNQSHGRYAAAVAQELAARGADVGMFYGSAPWFAAAGLTAAMVPPGWRRLHLAAYSTTPDDKVALPPGWGRDQLYARQYTSSASQPGIPGSSDRSRVVREWLTTGDDMPLSQADLDAIGTVVEAKLDAATGGGQRDWEGTVRATLAAIQADYNLDSAEVAALARVEAALTAFPAGPAGPPTASAALAALRTYSRGDLAAIVAAGVQLLAAA